MYISYPLYLCIASVVSTCMALVMSMCIVDLIFINTAVSRNRLLPKVISYIILILFICRIIISLHVFV